MKNVTNNPYRQLGVLANSGVSQENTNKKRLVQYLNAEQEIPAR